MEKSAIKNMHGSTTLIFSQKLESKFLPFMEANYGDFRFSNIALFSGCLNETTMLFFQKKIRHLASIDSVIRFLSVQISTNANHYQVRHKLYKFFFCKYVLTIN